MNTFDNVTVSGTITQTTAATSDNHLARLVDVRTAFATLFQGAYASGTAYTAGQMVTSAGALYLARVNSQGYTPASNPTQWAVLVESLSSAFLYVAYASDDIGTGFTMTFDADLDYIAFKPSATEIVSPSASDFTGLWKNVRGPAGASGGSGGGAGQIRKYTSDDPNADGIIPADITQPAIAYKLGGGPSFVWNDITHVWE
jgi:hypothetical protein